MKTKKEIAQKMMAEESKGGIGFHSGHEHQSVNLTPKFKHTYSKGEKLYIKASGGLKTKPNEVQGGNYKKKMSNKALGTGFLKSKFAKDIPDDRKKAYAKEWGVKDNYKKKLDKTYKEEDNFSTRKSE